MTSSPSPAVDKTFRLADLRKLTSAGLTGDFTTEFEPPSDEVKRLHLNAFVVSNTLSGTGTFFLLYEGHENKAPGSVTVQIQLVRPDKSIKSWESFASPIFPKQLIAMNSTTVLMLAGPEEAIVMLKSEDNWGSYSLTTDHGDFRSLLLLSLSQFTKNGRPSDCVFKFVKKTTHCSIICTSGEDRQAIKVNKRFLEFRWPHFRTLFYSQESCIDKWEVDDVSRVTMNAVISFLHDDPAPLNFDVAIDLLRVAQKYRVPGLLDHAMERIRKERLDEFHALVACNDARKTDFPMFKNYFTLRMRSGGDLSHSYPKELAPSFEHMAKMSWREYEGFSRYFIGGFASKPERPSASVESFISTPKIGSPSQKSSKDAVNETDRERYGSPGSSSKSGSSTDSSNQGDISVASIDNESHSTTLVHEEEDFFLYVSEEENLTGESRDKGKEHEE